MRAEPRKGPGKGAERGTRRLTPLGSPRKRPKGTNSGKFVASRAPVRGRQLHPECTYIQEAVLNEMSCAHCGATVNPVTGDGLHSPETEPWMLICNQCQHMIVPDLHE